MARTPKTAYQSPCHESLKGAYFPLIQPNEQATGTILALVSHNLQMPLSN